MTKKEKLEYVRDGLAGYSKLERRAVDEIGWIAFKLSCTRAVAARLIAEVHAKENGT